MKCEFNWQLFSPATGAACQKRARRKRIDSWELLCGEHAKFYETIPLTP